MGRAGNGAASRVPRYCRGKEEAPQMKTAVFLIVAVALVLGAGAFAQDKVNPLSVKLGVYWPSEDCLKDLANSWFCGEVDYGFNRDYDKNSEWHVQLGWTQKSKTFTSEGRSEGYDQKVEVRIIPLTVGIRYDQPAQEQGAGYWYFGWSVGCFFAHLDYVGNTSNKTAIGGTLYAGYQFNDNLFLEGKYQITDNFGDWNGNGFVAMLGVRLTK
jgi:hypothetical protein